MKELLKLALPVVLTYLGSTSMGIVDILLVGRISPTQIGAVGIGTSLFLWVFVFGLGLSSSLEYLVSHAYGAGLKKKQLEYLVQGSILTTGIAVPLTAGLVLLSLHLEYLGVTDEVIEPAKKYSVILSLSLVFSLLFNVFRLFLTAQGKAKPALVLLILGNLLNAWMGYVLVLGHWGAPSLGAEGAAWATLTTRFVMTLSLGYFIYRWDQRNEKQLIKMKFEILLPVMKEMLRLGLPSAIQMMLEVGVFTLATALAARLSAAHLAAHQIVLNTASLTFMVPFGIASATAVLVGQALGRKQKKVAFRTGWRGLFLGTGFMALSCVLLLCFSNQILSLFTTDPEVISIGKRIFLVAAFFQLSDGIQTVGTGALRGMGKTRGPMVFNLCGHWVLGLPMSILLCFHFGWGLKGLWIGLSVGLTAVATGVLTQWWMLSQSQR